MLVSEALETRITCRAFLADPVPEATVRAILTQASRAPSGGNLQPWHVWAITGDELNRFLAIIKEKMAAGQVGDGPTEYHIYPPELKEPYRSRRFKVGEDMYATIGVPREDKAGRMVQFARNFEFFGAPVAMFFAIDRTMQQGQWSDLGMFIQSIMLLAREHGLHTAPQEAWAIWHKTVGAFLDLPPELMLFCGLGLGRMDMSHPINRLRTERASLSEIASLRGF
ncbi:MAG TPA: nitroreductase family protein [Alphaproteobacteria bacterium]|nr:nitroreductase family protein [Alphaproteobacteria bacterium]HAJ48328.1 nitroreductase family protein [Alphaproteobacteria bacterium]